MLSSKSILICVFLIPTILTLSALCTLNTQNTIQSLPLQLNTLLLFPKAAHGRHNIVRRQLGIPERSPNLLPESILPLVSESALLSSNNDSIRRKMRRKIWKRDLDFVVQDSPVVHDHHPSLKLTEDSTWDYSLQMEEVLASFEIVAQRDFEVVAQANLIKRKARRDRKVKTKGSHHICIVTILLTNLTRSIVDQHMYLSKSM